MTDVKFVPNITPITATWLNDVNTTVNGLPTSGGSALVGTIQAGTGAVLRTTQDKLRDVVNAKDFGAIGEGFTDDSAAIAAAIVYARPLKRKVVLPAGTYRVVSSLPFIEGTQLVGELGFAYINGFGIEPGGTTILFQPTVANSDLFVANGLNHSGFRLHYSVEGIYIKGNANARYALDLDHVIYSRFENLAIDTFQYPIRCNGTINNRFCNVFLSGTTASVLYAGNSETTDVWEQATFFGGPSGPIFLGTSIGVRFNNPLFEQLDTYGMQIAKECQVIQVIGGYGEDCPYTNTATGAMFKVGYSGTTLSSENQLTIIGGKYSGRNAGTVGSFLDTDYCNGVTMQGVTHSRFTNIIKTSANTRDNSIAVVGGSGVGWTTHANDYNKISGTYPTSVNNSGSATQTARFPVVISDSLSSLDNTTKVLVTGGALQFQIGAAGAAWPTVDNTKSFGISSNRWSTIYAGTGAINTSDEREKQQIMPIDEAALRAWAKVEYVQFKFNDAVATKEDGARWHFGLIAQRIKAAFESEGLDPFAYGVLCYDEWEGGDRYGVRYEEALVLECAYLRSKI